jgi:hypothetical protein
MVFRTLQAMRGENFASKNYPAVARKDFFLHPASEVFKVCVFENKSHLYVASSICLGFCLNFSGERLELLIVHFLRGLRRGFHASASHIL